MAYFTTVLQHQVNNIWRKRIEDAYAEMKLYASGKAIRDYLNNRQTLCTAGFVIRRFLQNAYPELLEKVKVAAGCGYADLSNNLNVPWPEAFVSELAKELYRISKEKRISISRTTWVSYLDDAPIKMYRNTPFKVAFALSMNIDTTEELLMACGQDAYCFRNPEHFIYYYCQSRSDYSWGHAQQLIERYKAGLVRDAYTANDASSGMTNVLRSDVKRLFSEKTNEIEADDELIEYMILHQKEFSGLSLTARTDFLKMAAYLAVLYPSYSRVSTSKDRKTGEYEEVTEEVPVGFLPDGTPNLSELIRALFSTGGWLPTTVEHFSGSSNEKRERTASSIRRRENSKNIEYKRAETDETNDRPFLNSVQFFVDSYAHHVDAIDRVYRRPASPDNVERRDVILFTYFFIRRYPELLADEETYGSQLDRLTSLVYDDGRIDMCMDYLMEELYTMTMNRLEKENADRYDRSGDTIDYIGLFNEVLRSFGMKGMYMPNPWDRFITMSLFAEDPDFFTEAVLWNTVADDEPDSGPEFEEDEGSDPDSLKNEYETAGTTERLIPAEKPDKPTPTAVLVKYPADTPSVPGKNGHKEFLRAALLRVNTGEYITVDKSCFVFGRMSSNPEVIQDYGFPVDPSAGISRSHAVVLFYENRFYLVDVSKGNNTWLNDIQLEPGYLKPSRIEPVVTAMAYPLIRGDRIRLGSEEFVFMID